MRIAFLFPGQGSLRGGAARAWRGHTAHGRFASVGAVVGLDLERLADDPDSGASTAVAQPAILAASLAALDALEGIGVRPDVVAGHSLGEVTAAVAAGVLSTRDGAELVAERGRAMAAACRNQPGAMAAVMRVEDAALEGILRSVPDATVANENAPGQTVVAGPPRAVERVAELVREAGGRAIALDVEGAFHSPAMAPALVAVDRALHRLPTANPRVPLISGTSGTVLHTDAAVRRALVDGILAPVRWRAVQERLAQLECDLLVEVGPGGVLAGLAKRTLRGTPVLSVAGPDDVDAVAEHVRVHGAVVTREPSTAGASR